MKNYLHQYLCKKIQAETILLRLVLRISKIFRARLCAYYQVEVTTRKNLNSHLTPGKIFCSYEYISEKHQRENNLNFVKIGFSSKFDNLISISPWYRFDTKVKHVNKRFLIADGVFDLAAIVSDLKTSKIWVLIINYFEYITPYQISIKEYERVHKILINNNPRKIEGLVRICLATANTPFFSNGQEKRLKKLYSEIIHGLNNLSNIEIYYCPGKHAKKFFNEILSSKELSLGNEKDLGWCLSNCHILISTKSTILLDAQKNGLITIEVINKVIGNSVSSVKLFDSDSIQSFLNSLESISGHKNIRELYINIINEIQKRD